MFRVLFEQRMKGLLYNKGKWFILYWNRTLKYKQYKHLKKGLELKTAYTFYTKMKDSSKYRAITHCKNYCCDYLSQLNI